MTAQRRTLDLPVAAAVTVFLLIVYALGASRTIYVGDSGELVAAVHTLGIPHPSGYPLYVLLGKLFTLAVPIGTIAFRMSLFSAVCAALTCGGLYSLARSIGLDRPSALLSALLLGFAPSFWSQANVQRVYALNALFVVAATLAAVRWQDTRSDRSIALAFFICGLGACNHTFMGVFAVALGLFMLWIDPAVLGEPERLLRRSVAVGGAFFVGLLPYAYLPIRSSMNPRLDWGNPETLAGFRGVVMREDFWERKWIESAADLIPIGLDYAIGLCVELAWIGVPLLAVGAWLGLTRHARRGPVVLLLLVMVINLAAMALHGSRSDIFIWHRYYIPSYVAGALLAGMGWNAIGAALAGRLDGRLASAARAAILVVPLLMLVVGYRSFDRSRYRIAETFARAVLDSLPPGAHLIATDDNVLFVLIYLRLVEGLRPDVNLILQGVGKADLPPLRFNPDDDPLYFTHHPNWDLPTLEIVPEGVVYRARRRGADLPPVEIPIDGIEGELDPRVPKDYLTQNLLGHYHYTVGFTFEQRDWPRARAAFARAAAAASENDVLFYNLGLVFARNGLYEEAKVAFRRSAEINPRHLASLSKPRAVDKLAQTEAELARIARIEAEIDRKLAGRTDDAAEPAPPARGSAARHMRVAAELDARGERLAARGHRLRALDTAPRSP